jgi:hypothetical protein
MVRAACLQRQRSYAPGMTSATQGVARVHVAAPAECVYALISDVSRMGDWSPETDNCEWLDGATSAAVGVRFRGSNHLGPVKWRTECIITAATPGEEFAFSVMHPDGREETAGAISSHPPKPGPKSLSPTSSCGARWPTASWRPSSHETASCAGGFSRL